MTARHAKLTMSDDGGKADLAPGGIAVRKCEGFRPSPRPLRTRPVTALSGTKPSICGALASSTPYYGQLPDRRALERLMLVL